MDSKHTPAPEGQIGPATILTQEQRLKVFGSVTNKSRAATMALALLGPLGRVWAREGEPIKIGEQHSDGSKEIFGTGATFAEALASAAADLTAGDLVELAGPELALIQSADVRRMVNDQVRQQDKKSKVSVRERRRQARDRLRAAEDAAAAVDNVKSEGAL